MENNILEMQHITKRFPGVLALNDVSFEIRRGEIHGLVGENGAGKSTLMKILSGVISRDSGQILVDGAPVDIAGSKDSVDLGISIIYQEFNLIPMLSVAENLFLGRLTRGSFVRWGEIQGKARELMNSLDFEIDVERAVESLTVAEMQMVEIAKALSFNARLIIMDEPSSTLTEKELENFFHIVKLLHEKGISIIYISHRLEEIFRICDRVTVIRDGHVIDTMNVSGTNRESIIEKMVGRKLDNEFPPRSGAAGTALLLEVERLNAAGGKIKNVSFHLREREILGIAGLVGAGRTELVRAIFGADSFESGTVRVRGRVAKVGSPSQAKGRGLGLLPEDRKQHGVILGSTVKENISLTKLGRVSRQGVLRKRREEDLVAGFISQLHIRTPRSTQKVLNLSGGNQQKIVVAKWLFSEADILIMDEPTRGIDVGAKYEIYTLMNELTEMGKSLIIISSELPELLAMSDRIIVLHNGELKGELDRKDATAEKVLSYAIG
jgi:ribose transport system ATP-binding protein